MAKAYTPGLKVSARSRVRVRRSLPVAGETLVTVGQRVGAEEVVARTFTEGEVTPVNLANLLGCPAGDVPGCLLKKVGDAVAANEIVARSKGIFGFGKKDVASPVAGTIESVSGTTGQMIVRGARVPVEVKAYLAGTVVERPRSSCRASSGSAARPSARSAWPAPRRASGSTRRTSGPSFAGRS
jgi:hypothetical protein